MEQEYYRKVIRGEVGGPGPALLRTTGRLASVPYALAIRIRNALFDLGWRTVQRVNVPVISVGNITVGGTGKTPFTEYLAGKLLEGRKRVVLLSRGYGAKAGPNDEALVLARSLPDVPHLQGKDRVELAKRATLELNPDVILLDDGFQHRRLGRDLDIVLVDASDPFGGGWLLPGGLLREPLSGLKRAHAIVLTRCDQLPPDERTRLRSRIERYAGRPLWAEMRFAPCELVRKGYPNFSASWLKGRYVLGFCGIGNPESFWRTIESTGAILKRKIAFADHQQYGEREIDRIADGVRAEGVEAILTTIKDLVKLPFDRLIGWPLYALQTKAIIESGEKELLELVFRTIARKHR